MKKKLTKLVCAVMAVAVLAGALLPVTQVQAKTKLKESTKSFVTLYGSDGNTYESGDTVPLSALKGATFTANLTGVNAYAVACIIDSTNYKVSKDPEPGWAWENVVVDKSKKSLAKKITKYFSQYDGMGIYGKTDQIKLDQFCYDIAKGESYAKVLTITAQGVKANGEYRNTEYYNYFKVNKNK